MPRNDTNHPLGGKDFDQDIMKKEFQGIEDYIGALGTDADQHQDSARHGGLHQSMSYETGDPRQEGSRQESFNHVELPDLKQEGSKGNDNGFDNISQAEIRNTSEAFIPKEGSKPAASTFVPLGDDTQGYDKQLVTRRKTSSQ